MNNQGPTKVRYPPVCGHLVAAYIINDLTTTTDRGCVKTKSDFKCGRSSRVSDYGSHAAPYLADTDSVDCAQVENILTIFENIAFIHSLDPNTTFANNTADV
jgi:hypothetical protein